MAFQSSWHPTPYCATSPSCEAFDVLCVEAYVVETCCSRLARVALRPSLKTEFSVFRAVLWENLVNFG